MKWEILEKKTIITLEHRNGWARFEGDRCQLNSHMLPQDSESLILGEVECRCYYKGQKELIKIILMEDSIIDHGETFKIAD